MIDVIVAKSYLPHLPKMTTKNPIYLIEKLIETWEK